MYKKITLGKILGYSFVIIYALLTLLPLLWGGLNSLKNSREIFENPMGLPQSLEWSNWVRAWKNGIPTLFFNSITVTSISVIIGVFASSMLAYVIARIKLLGTKYIYLFILLAFAIPMHTILVPMYRLLNNMNLLNTRLGIIFPSIAFSIPFNTIIFYSFFINFPKTLEEAAMIDGATRFQSFIKILIPLSKPVFISCAIIQGLMVWNDFFIALLVVAEDRLNTLPLGLTQYQSQFSTEWGPLMATVIIGSLPMIIIYVLLQKHFIASFAGWGK